MDADDDEPGPRETPADDDELEAIPLSALEHYSYCPRQCGLIHLEQVWDENLFTLRGRQAHERVDALGWETRPGVRREFALPLWSRRLGLTGRADLVEFTTDGPYPVEHKIGKQRAWDHEAIQLCAQAICLEEMLGCSVPRGAIYYHGSRARREVQFDEPLRDKVAELTVAIRTMLQEARLPPAVNDARCRHCSLLEACLPDVVARPGRQAAWRRALFSVDDDGEAGSDV